MLDIESSNVAQNEAILMTFAGVSKIYINGD